MFTVRDISKTFEMPWKLLVSHRGRVHDNARLSDHRSDAPGAFIDTSPVIASEDEDWEIVSVAPQTDPTFIYQLKVEPSPACKSQHHESG